jgi:hypothetical protein
MIKKVTLALLKKEFTAADLCCIVRLSIIVAFKYSNKALNGMEF